MSCTKVLFALLAVAAADIEAAGEEACDEGAEADGVCLLQAQRFLQRDRSSEKPWLRLMKRHQGLSHAELRENHMPFKVSDADLKEAMRTLPFNYVYPGRYVAFEPVALASSAAKKREQSASEKVLAKVTDLPPLTSTERERYCERFGGAIQEDAQKVLSADAKKNLTEAEMEEILVQEFINQYPALTQADVEELAKETGLSWHAELAEWMEDISVEKYEGMHGLKELSEAEQKKMRQAAALTQKQLSLLESGMGAPQNFNPLEGDAGKFPKACLPLIQHVRDQGTCGSCWAQAAVGAFNDRLCIASGGAFTTKLSTMDLAFCDKRSMGCGGGYVEYALDGYLKNSGISTGGDQDDVGKGQLCKPYSLGGRGRDHFHRSQSSKECTSTCSESAYPRAYSSDKYWSDGNSYQLSKHDFNQVKTELYEKGSITYQYDATRAHMSYKSGIWDGRGGPQPTHGIKCVGYGVDPTHGNYLVCVNSWGRDWGDNGSFKVKFPGGGALGSMQGFDVSWAGRNENVGIPPTQQGGGGGGGLEGDDDKCLQDAWGNPAYTCAQSKEYCDSYPDAMHKCCKGTCEVVPLPGGEADSDDPNCKDDSSSCASWAASGECDKNPGYMHTTCAKSCDTCAAADPTCTDSSDSCSWWAKSGECTKSPDYMLQNCKKSCDNCGSEGSDKSSSCAAWAAAGECTKNPGYMTPNCPASCAR